jgi:exonuclease VII small subunit
MTDARWIEVEDDLESACNHFANGAQLYGQGGFNADGLAGYQARMALLPAMQSGHTSLEGALKRILEILGEEAPTGEQPHADLVKRVSRVVDTPGHVRPAVLTPEVARDVRESRRFRHRATHDYDNFGPIRAVPSIEAARRLAESLKPCIAAFRENVDPPTHGWQSGG